MVPAIDYANAGRSRFDAVGASAFDREVVDGAPTRECRGCCSDVVHDRHAELLEC
jgi:hypothetical protein